LFNAYAPTINIDDPLPPEKEPTEEEGDQYLQLLNSIERLEGTTIFWRREF